MLLTNHMKVRMQQRGRNHLDLELVRQYGSKLSPSTFIMRKRDRQLAARKLKSQLPPHQSRPLIQRLDHLTGFRLILNPSGTAITGYHRPKKLGRGRRRF